MLVRDKKRDKEGTKEERECVYVCVRERFMEGRVRREKYLLLMRLCSHMLAPPHFLQPLLMRLCSRMLLSCLHKISVAYAYRESADE